MSFKFLIADGQCDCYCLTVWQRYYRYADVPPGFPMFYCITLGTDRMGIWPQSSPAPNWIALLVPLYRPYRRPYGNSFPMWYNSPSNPTSLRIDLSNHPWHSGQMSTTIIRSPNSTAPYLPYVQQTTSSTTKLYSHIHREGQHCRLITNHFRTDAAQVNWATLNSTLIPTDPLPIPYTTINSTLITQDHWVPLPHKTHSQGDGDWLWRHFALDYT